MRRYVVIFFILFSYLWSAAQPYDNRMILPAEPDSSAVLTMRDQLQLMGAPQLKLSQRECDIVLPSSVNNATLPYMIPIFYQSGSECGQVSSICYTFSYEIMRRRQEQAIWGYNYHYPSRFAWNFCNGGTGSGVNFMESWEVIRTAGTPTVNAWGGWYNYGAASRWINGYEVYHSAMKNRISEMCAIPIDNEEGLLTLKHWLYDHLNGESTGGLANFYCTYMGNDHLSLLAPGTPDAGKYILTNFTSNVNHSKTIVGYNDSIRWDYNGDGRYTNDIDINGDGVVNLQDWEIGAVIFCNSFGTAFGNDGYCYLPYCKLASLPDNGGIWNHTVYVVQVKDRVYPQITYKATVRHTARNKLKMTAGVSTNPNATTPEHTMEFGIFNYQGGELYMQGDTTEAAKTLEFGLDVSPLLNHIEPDQPCKFFFTVSENDANNAHSGAIVNFSIMDYTSGSVEEQPCASTNTPIANNTNTTLSIVRSIHFTKPHITDSVLPTINAFESYSQSLHATGGKSPYRWELSRQFQEESISTTPSTTSGSAVTLSNSNNGYAIISLGFDFPFYGETYNQIIAYADGYLTFHHQPANWPFLQNSTLQTQNYRMLCPFRADLTNCSIQKKVEADGVIIQYTAQKNNQNESSLHFEIKLFHSGEIEFRYGNLTYNGTDYESALYYGNGHDIQKTSLNALSASSLSNRSIRLTPSILPEGLYLSSDGVLSGTMDHAFEDATFYVTCYDNNDVQETKQLRVSCEYNALLVITELKVNESTEPYLFSGDTAVIDLKLRNMDNITYGDGTLLLTTNDPYVQLIDSTEFFGTIAPGSEYALHRCLRCVIAPNTPDGHVVHLNIQIGNSVSPVDNSRSFTIHSNLIELQGYDIHDYGSQPNYMLDPIELDTILFHLKNISGLKINNLDFVLRIERPDIDIPVSTLHLNNLNEEEEFDFPTLTYIHPTFESGTHVIAYIDIYINNHLLNTLTAIILGQRECYDFDNSAIPETMFFSGQREWYIDQTFSHSGSYSLRSGTIDHNDTSIVSMRVNCCQSAGLSFQFRTSTENNYDWLCFYVDSARIERWSGTNDWTSYNTMLNAGEHLLSWSYLKDYSQSSGYDAVWIDDICISGYFDAHTEFSVQPNQIEATINKALCSNLTDTIHLYNVSSTYSTYCIQITDSAGSCPNWVHCEPATGLLEEYDSTALSLFFTAYDCEPGIYEATLGIYHFGDTTYLPILLQVIDDPDRIDDHFLANGTHIYPNPAIDHCYIVNESNYIYSLQIYNLVGQLISDIPIQENLYKLDISTLKSGVYLIDIQTADGIITHKLIKQ